MIGRTQEEERDINTIIDATQAAFPEMGVLAAHLESARIKETP